MWTMGDSPYNWLEPRQVADHLQSGQRMAKPAHADDHMFVCAIYMQENPLKIHLTPVLFGTDFTCEKTIFDTAI